MYACVIVYVCILFYSTLIILFHIMLFKFEADLSEFEEDVFCCVIGVCSLYITLNVSNIYYYDH